MDDKELEKAALDYCAKCLDITKRNVDLDKDECVDLYNSFIDSAKWMQKKFLKDLWHPMQEEPKLVGEEIIIDVFLKGKRYPMVQKYMVGVKFLDTIETIRWISNWDSFLSEICDDVKMIRWCYFKDLLPKA